MTWVRLDDQFVDHPKVAAAGPLAAWLYVCGLTYSARYLTDGFIPASQVRRLADLPEPAALAAKLIEVGLWECDGDGYRVHDYLDYNPAAELVKRERDANAERMRNARAGSVRPNVQAHNGRSSPVPSPVPVPDQNPVLDPRPDPAGDEDDAPEAPSAASEEPDSRRLVGDLLVGKSGFRETAEFWAALDELDGRIPLRLEVLKSLDWLRDKRKPKVTARFVLGWLQRAARDSLPPPSDADTGSAPPPPPVFPVVTWPDGQPPEPKAAELWTATLGVLAGQMNRGNFEAYFRETRGLALDNGHLVVGVKNPYVLDQLGRQFGHLLRRTLEDIPGAPPDVRLVVGP